MSLFKNSLLGLVLLAALPAGAEQLLQGGLRSSVSLYECGGYASLERSWGDLTLVVDEVKFCSNLTVNGIDYKLNENSDKTRSGRVRLDESRNSLVLISSNSGKHADSLRVLAAPTPPPARVTRLASCGGTVEKRVTALGDVNLIFRNVENCSNFDILSANGESVDYPNKKLQEQGNGLRGGSFTIPQRFVQLFFNGVTVVVKSNSGQHKDVVRVYFLAL